VACPTARQLEVIAAVVATGSQKAAAASLGITEHTVNGSLGRLRCRLDCVSLEQAVYILTARGLLVVNVAAYA
jgi:DNA-binding transcriptional LysR family regulator